MPDVSRMSIAESWATSDRAPLWVAISLYAVAHADARGCAHLSAGQLRKAVAPTASQTTVSNAIRRAAQAGWLEQDSTAWCLRVARPKAVQHGA